LITHITNFQENLKFLSHFHQKFVITKGSRKDAAMVKKGKVEVSSRKTDNFGL